MTRAAGFLAALTAACVLLASATLASEQAAWAALKDGGVVLFRHANAPGGGDPAGMRLGDCASQRNLDDVGRAQARRIGETIRARGVTVSAVLTSQWCRAQQTAALAFPATANGLQVTGPQVTGPKVIDEPAFNSFFDDRSAGPGQTAAARRILAAWTGPGALFVATHQVNITALTGIVPASAEGIVLARERGEWRVAGRIKP